MADDLTPPQTATDARRPRGRPRGPREPLSQVSTRIPVRQYERIVQLAKAQDLTVSAFLRERLTRR